MHLSWVTIGLAIVFLMFGMGLMIVLSSRGGGYTDRKNDGGFDLAGLWFWDLMNKGDTPKDTNAAEHAHHHQDAGGSHGGGLDSGHHH